jgi:hypothetical protein
MGLGAVLFHVSPGTGGRTQGNLKATTFDQANPPSTNIAVFQDEQSANVISSIE